MNNIDFLLEEFKEAPEEIRKAFEQGWRAAASWAPKYHLDADVDSPAYHSEFLKRMKNEIEKSE